MREKVVVFSILAVMALASSVWAANGQNYFRFNVQSHQELDKLTKLISIDNVDGLTVFAYANDQEFAEFKKLGFAYTILPDPGSLISPRMGATPQEIIADWDVYPTYQGYLDMMNQFAATYPDLCAIVNIGSSVQGRELLFAKISDNVNQAEDEPEVQYSSSMHGDETAGYVLMLRLIDYLLSNYGADQEVTDMINGLEIWINPLANPDGAYRGGNNSVNGAIRYNANGVDLNRNFPDPADGPHPDGRAWQPETIAMMDFFDQHNFTISANFHGGAEVVNYPWDTWSRRHPDDAWWIHISRAYADTVHLHAPSGYMTDLNNGITNGYDWYRVAGGRQDYITYNKGGREVTIELSAAKLLPAGQLPSHWTYNYRSFVNFLKNALNGVRGVVTDSQTGLPLGAKVTVLNHDADSSSVHTDPAAGDYHRMIIAGAYDLEFTSLGYVPVTINDVQVANWSATELNVALTPIPNTPLLVFQSHDIGNVDAGDSVVAHITLANNGGGNANGVTAILSSPDPYIVIFQDSSDYPVIPALGGAGVSLSPYRFYISPSCPSYHEASFRLDISASGGYTDSAFFGVIIGRSIEDFETGNFAGYPWQMGGNANWTIVTNAPFEGAYCAKSGTISHNQQTELSVPLDITSAGAISFYYKISSESGYDYLKFYIDGVQQGQWAGEIPWTQASFHVSAGSHTFKWGYYKDNSVSNGSDCGWIDYIVFPPIGQPLPYVPGDANNSGEANGIDVGYLINYFKGGNPPPLQMDCPPHGLFYPACDANGNCTVNGIDITFMVNFFKGGSPLSYCVDCPPTLMLNRIVESSGKVE